MHTFLNPSVESLFKPFWTVNLKLIIFKQRVSSSVLPKLTEGAPLFVFWVHLHSRTLRTWSKTTLPPACHLHYPQSLESAAAIRQLLHPNVARNLCHHFILPMPGSLIRFRPLLLLSSSSHCPPHNHLLSLTMAVETTVSRKEKTMAMMRVLLWHLVRTAPWKCKAAVPLLATRQWRCRCNGHHPPRSIVSTTTTKWQMCKVFKECDSNNNDHCSRGAQQGQRHGCPVWLPMWHWWRFGLGGGMGGGKGMAVGGGGVGLPPPRMFGP